MSLTIFESYLGSTDDQRINYFNLNLLESHFQIFMHLSLLRIQLLQGHLLGFLQDSSTISRSFNIFLDYLTNRYHYPLSL